MLQLTTITERLPVFSIWLQISIDISVFNHTCACVRPCVWARVCISPVPVRFSVYLFTYSSSCCCSLLSLLLLSNKVSSLLCFQRKKETAAVATERVETGAQNITQHKTRTDRFVASEPIKTKFPKSLGLYFYICGEVERQHIIDVSYSYLHG